MPLRDFIWDDEVSEHPEHGAGFRVTARNDDGDLVQLFVTQGAVDKMKAKIAREKAQ